MEIQISTPTHSNITKVSAFSQTKMEPISSHNGPKSSFPIAMELTFKGITKKLFGIRGRKCGSEGQSSWEPISKWFKWIMGLRKLERLSLLAAEWEEQELFTGLITWDKWLVSLTKFTELLILQSCQIPCSWNTFHKSKNGKKMLTLNPPNTTPAPKITNTNAPSSAGGTIKISNNYGYLSPSKPATPAQCTPFTTQKTPTREWRRWRSSCQWPTNIRTLLIRNAWKCKALITQITVYPDSTLCSTPMPSFSTSNLNMITLCWLSISILIALLMEAQSTRLKIVLQLKWSLWTPLEAFLWQPYFLIFLKMAIVCGQMHVSGAMPYFRAAYTKKTSKESFDGRKKTDCSRSRWEICF